MKIEKLIDKYFEGETTPEEEKEIYEFLMANPNDRVYDDIRRMMQGFKAASVVSISEKIDYSFMAAPKKKLVYYSAAAIIIFTVSTLLFFNLKNETGIIITNHNIEANKDLAQEEIGKAFEIASEQFIAAASNLETINISNKSINPLEKLELINQYLNKKKVKS